MSCQLMECGNDAVVSSSVISGNRASKYARYSIPYWERNVRETLAVVFLRMGRAEVQAGTDALCFQRFHQRVAGQAAACFINANNKQVPGVTCGQAGTVSGWNGVSASSRR
jgi:hypothetical protein